MSWWQFHLLDYYTIIILVTLEQNKVLVLNVQYVYTRINKIGDKCTIKVVYTST